MSPDNRHNGSAGATSPGGSESRQDLVSRSLPSFMSSAHGTRVGKGDHAVVWNRQHCFEWVSPADELRLCLERKQAMDPSPAITIIEYHSARPSSNVGALCERLDVIDKRLDTVCERLEQVVVPLTEENRALRNQELDMHVVRPTLEHIIQTLSRMDDELRNDSDGGVFGVLRDAREADREEQRQLLRHYGVSAKYPKRGDRFSASVHEVISRITTDSTERVGRVRRVMRPAYLRERDGHIIARAWVEVYVEAKQKTGL